MQALFNNEIAVRDRYTKAAISREAALCCPVEYDPRYLEAIPKEVLDIDYGCGDPSRYLKPGETVLDLGCGAGKICFIASQIVGPTGRVIGIDMTQEMLDVARKNAPSVADRIGYANIGFKRGLIQDLSLDMDALEDFLRKHPVNSAHDYINLDKVIGGLRKNNTLIEDASVDVVVSNCVLNLVEVAHRKQMFQEIYRVLHPGGRAVISDIVSSRCVPEEMRRDPELWSGCVSGAMTETAFLAAFESVGFRGMQIIERNAKPWRTYEQIEFRSMTVEAFKPLSENCSSSNRLVIYRGPYKEVLDEDGHRISRGASYYVCDKTYELYRQRPYRTHFFLPGDASIDPCGAALPSEDEEISQSCC